MCLAVPAQIVRLLEEEKALVEREGIRQTISLALVPEAKEGDFVVVHVGFALSVLDTEEARQTQALLEALPEAEEAGEPPLP